MKVKLTTWGIVSRKGRCKVETGWKEEKGDLVGHSFKERRC